MNGTSVGYCDGEEVRDRRLPRSLSHTFAARLLTLSLSPLGRCPGVAQVPSHKFDTHVVLRPPARSRPGDVAYACHVKAHGNVVPRARFLESATSLRANGAPVHAELRAFLYGEELGSGAVDGYLTPSKRLRMRAKLAEINASMSEALRKAREEAAEEAGVELPPLSPPPPPAAFWRGPRNKPLLSEGGAAS